MQSGARTFIISKPFIDYVLKPIGGETFGFDMMNVRAPLCIFRPHI